MNCSEVVAHFTDYLDGVVSDVEAGVIAWHLEECSACRRYANVLEHGARVLRSLPEPELPEDFTPRLQHRLFHVDDERTIGPHGASGAPALTVLGIAVLLTAVAWSPTLYPGAPVVELPAIVVDRAPDRSPVRPVSASPPGTFSTKSEGELRGV
jgi:anti-sigma factor RsiW